MALQHLDKTLPNHAGRAENPDRKLIAHKRVLPILQQPLFAEEYRRETKRAQKPTNPEIAVTSSHHRDADFSSLQYCPPSADRRFWRITMPELRQNFFTKEWVIIATERARRPEELATHRPVQAVPAFLETCPFCPGNESKTPPEVMRFPMDAGKPWAVRVIPNKFAALSSDVQPTRSLQHLRRRIEGFGFHEVIIDSPDHSGYMALLPDAQVASILRIYKARYNSLSMDHRINHI